VISKLHHILKPFLLRRMKADVEVNLPRKKEILLYAQMTKQQQEYKEQLLNKTLDEYLAKESGSGTASFNFLVVLKTLLDPYVLGFQKGLNTWLY
jgi:SNF2 family DNA or RNA helicase